MAEGFLSRWARLKRERDAGEGELPAEVPAALPADPSQAAPAPVVGRGEGEAVGNPTRADADRDAATGGVATEAATGTEAPRGPGAPLPELPPVDALTPDSDFTPFLRQGVSPATRNAALKKLFADPAFNVMDGLDVYIEDYNQTTPIPEDLLRRLAQSRALGLFDEPADDARAAELGADEAGDDESRRVASAAGPGARDAPPELAAPVRGGTGAQEEGDGPQPIPAAAEPEGEMADRHDAQAARHGDRSPQ